MATDDTEIEDSSPATGSPGPGDEPKRLERGTSIGRYVVIDFVDAGGMGAIYQAFDPELNRPVALKLLAMSRKGQDAAAAETDRSRMLREAQALAQLSHPNVVAVHDVGEFQGSLFIAMEFVEGSNLKVWLESKTPDRKEVIEKLLQAGRGLAAAHKAGIVHRDFKPGNVIVGKDGRVMVLDFGLARATVANPSGTGTDADSSADNAEKLRARQEALAKASVSGRSVGSSGDLLYGALTQAGKLQGTIPYMAPEQMDLMPVDERTDQFSFCVTLFEALYGCRPFDSTSATGIYRNIRSGKVTRPADRKIPSWLDDIILKGLSFDSTERFSSMDELLGALEADPEIIHKAQLERRRRIAGWIGSIAVSLLIAGSGIWYASTKGSRLCQGSEEKLAGVWDAEAKARVKKAFLGTSRPYAASTFERVAAILDGYGSRWATMRTEACEATHVRGEQSEQLLDLRMGCYTRRLSEMDALISLFINQSDEGVVDRAVQATMGLSLIDACADLEALGSAVPPPEKPEVRRKVEALRRDLDAVWALEAAGKYPESLALAGAALAESQALDYRPVQAEALYRVGSAQERLAHYEQAAKTMEAVAALADEARYDEVRARATTSLLAIEGCRLGRPNEVEPLVVRSKAVVERLGEEGVLKADWLNNAGLVLFTKGSYGEANPLWKSALAIRERVLGPDHPQVATSLNNRANLYYVQGKYSEAETLYKRALAVKEKALGPEHPDVPLSLSNLANVYFSQGKYPEAEFAHKQALAIREKILGPQHPDVALSLLNLGNLYLSQAKYHAAEPLFLRVQAIREKALGPEHPDVAYSHNALASLYFLQGKVREAEPLYRRALAIWEKALGPEHVLLTWPLSGIGGVLLKQNKREEARKLFDRVLAICGQDRCKGQEIQALSEVKFGLARILITKAHDKARALQLAREALEFLATDKSVLGKGSTQEAGEFLKQHGN